ncbi:ABC transporter permease subunit [Streptomyces xanthochromogenes]|uniref:ABC transporter permease n=1 Tax=Streptomyces xanthochromogenes TaxID=67384 RepID=A0ABQ3ABM9_9ACTN|nr:MULTISPECIES: ABC transporter permease subunit [Streptomyces]GGY45809.1 ABC transporter permease [Streptomyces xanthochromogenes]GHB27841.1 ABC transporter permease [Streptomyces xanthochromogenes]
MARLTHPLRPWRGAVLLIAGAYFAVPLLASLVFTVDVPGQGFTLDSYTQIFGADGFTAALLRSLGLALATVALALLLTLPAALAVRLSGSGRLRAVLEVVCTLPLVVPPVALVAGLGTVLKWGPDHLATTPLYETFVAIQNPSFPLVLVFAYVVMALPFVYRSLEAGLRAVDVRTLVEAARDLGASWPRALFTVVLPNLRTALLNASFLALALVLGEFTVASLLGFQPFAVWIVQASGANAQLSVAVSLLSLLLTWGLLLVLTGLARTRGGRGARTTGATRTIRKKEAV